MSANGRRLLSKALAEKSLRDILGAGLDDRHFPDEVDRDVFQTMLKHHNRYGKMPSQKTLKMDFPDYRFVVVEDPIESLIDRVVNDYHGAVLSLTINAAAECYDTGDFEAAKASLEAGIKTLTTTSVQGLRTVDLLSLADKWHADRSSNKRGIPLGLKEIDEETGGIYEDQFVVMIGPPGSGKSSHLLNGALAATKKGYRALFITIEMSDEHQWARAVANRAGVSYKVIRRGKPSRQEQEAIAEALEDFYDDDLLVIQEIPAELASLGTIREQIEKHAPDIVYIDGAYLMQLPNVGKNAPQWERLSALTRAMKDLILRTKRPIVITTQALESKMQGGNISAQSTGYSSSFHQDADLMIGIQPDGELEDRQVMKILKFRDGAKISVHVRWDWALQRRYGVVEEIEQREDGRDM